MFVFYSSFKELLRRFCLTDLTGSMDLANVAIIPDLQFIHCWPAPRHQAFLRQLERPPLRLPYSPQPFALGQSSRHRIDASSMHWEPWSEG